MATDSIKEVVRSKYGEAARRVAAGETGGCGCQIKCDPLL